MRITAFFPGKYPNGFAPMSYRLHYYMKALKHLGNDVKIIAIGNEETGGVFDGVPFSIKKTIKPTRINRRRINKQYQVICSELAKECELLLVVGRTINFVYLISNAVHQQKRKVVIEMNENPYSTFSNRRDTKIGLIVQRLIFLRIALPKVDGIITISEKLTDLACRYKKKSAKVVQIPILTGFKDKKTSSDYYGTPYILHAGALSEQKDGIKAVLKAFKIAHEKLNGKLKMIFTDKKSPKKLSKWIQSYIKKNNLENSVEFKGLIPKKELDQLFDHCSMAVINKPSNWQNDYNFPTKLTEFLPREKPVIVAKTGEMAVFFEDNKNGFVVSGNNAEQIAEKIIFIIRNPEKSKEVAIRGRILAEKEFFYLNHAKALHGFFKDVLNS